MEQFKITKSISRIPLGEINNYCILYGLSLDIENEEITVFEVELKDGGDNDGRCSQEKL